MIFLVAISTAFPGLLIFLLNKNMISEGYIHGEVDMDCFLFFPSNDKELKLTDILTILQV